ncbi:MAG: hypothetical protein ACXWM7_01370 [Parachlamydiaceae bacterium]
MSIWCYPYSAQAPALPSALAPGDFESNKQFSIQELWEPIKETNSQVGEKRTKDIKILAKDTFNKTLSDSAQKTLSTKNLSIKKREGTNREMTEAEFQEISNPAKLSKREVEDFVNFLITTLNKCNYPGNPTPEEKNAMQLARSYLSGEISPAALLEKEVLDLDLKFCGLHALPKGISLLQG